MPNERERLWDGTLDARAEAVVRAGVRLWAEQGRQAVSPQERLRRLRAVESALNKPVLQPRAQVWEAQSPSTAKSWRWLAVAALLALAALAGWNLLESERETPDRAGPVREPEKRIATAPPFLVQALPGAEGLWHRDPPPIPTPGAVWHELRSGERCNGPALVAAVRDAQGGEVELSGGHRVMLHPGAVVRVDGESRLAKVDLWLGRIEVTAGTGSLSLGERAATGRRELTLLAAQETAKAETAAPSDGVSVEWTRHANGPVLADLARLPVLKVRLAAEEAQSEPRPLPIPAGAAIQPGTANLLKVIDANLSGSPGEIAAKLQEALGVRVRLSEAAETATQGKQLSMALQQVTGAEAIAGLASKAGLRVEILEGEVVLMVLDEEVRKPSVPEEEF